MKNKNQELQIKPSVYIVFFSFFTKSQINNFLENGKIEWFRPFRKPRIFSLSQAIFANKQKYTMEWFCFCAC